MESDRHGEDRMAGERLDQRTAIKEQAPDCLRLETVEIVEEKEKPTGPSGALELLVGRVEQAIGQLDELVGVLPEILANLHVMTGTRLHAEREIREELAQNRHRRAQFCPVSTPSCDWIFWRSSLVIWANHSTTSFSFSAGRGKSRSSIS
jgi:hypothetical protein